VSAGVIDLSLWQLALALLLVAAVAIVSIRQALGLQRDLLLGSIRTIVQLYGVGLILAAVFAAARWYWVVLILVAMTGVATHAAVSRLPRPIPGAYGIAAVSLFVSTGVTLAYVIGVVVQVRPWYEPQYIIPIAGMILGSSMTSAALAGDRLQGELRVRAAEVAGALGATRGDDSRRQRDDDGGARAASGDDDGPDPRRVLAAPGYPLPDRRRVHAGRRHRARLALLRPTDRRPLSDARPPAPALPALAEVRRLPGMFAKCYPCSRFSLLPIFSVAPTLTTPTGKLF